MCEGPEPGTKCTSLVGHSADIVISAVSRNCSCKYLRSAHVVSRGCLGIYGTLGAEGVTHTLLVRCLLGLKPKGGILTCAFPKRKPRCRALEMLASLCIGHAAQELVVQLAPGDTSNTSDTSDTVVARCSSWASADSESAQELVAHLGHRQDHRERGVHVTRPGFRPRHWHRQQFLCVRVPKARELPPTLLPMTEQRAKRCSTCSVGQLLKCMQNFALLVQGR